MAKSLSQAIADNRAKRDTPWGRADHVTSLGEDGIVSVSTSSHGGIYVPDDLLSSIPEKHRKWAKKWSGSENWYERGGLLLDGSRNGLSSPVPRNRRCDQVQNDGRTIFFDGEMMYFPAPQRWTLMQPIKMFLIASSLRAIMFRRACRSCHPVAQTVGSYSLPQAKLPDTLKSARCKAVTRRLLIRVSRISQSPL